MAPGLGVLSAHQRRSGRGRHHARRLRHRERPDDGDPGQPSRPGLRPSRAGRAVLRRARPGRLRSRLVTGGAVPWQGRLDHRAPCARGARLGDQFFRQRAPVSVVSIPCGRCLAIARFRRGHRELRRAVACRRAHDNAAPRAGSGPIAIAASRTPGLDLREPARHRHAVLRDRGGSARACRRGIADMARLSVNLNKIALLRNSRRTGVPDVLRFGRIAHGAGADGLTAHPRPDERHIRRSDVTGLAELMRPWRPAFELNLEGYPDRRFLDIVAEVRPEQCTLVPDSPEAFTSEEGWKLDAAQHSLLDPALTELKPLGCRVILFIDPDAAAVVPVHNTGTDGIEIYTGSYAAAFRQGDHAALLSACAAAERAAELGLVVNIGHDLNLE